MNIGIQNVCGGDSRAKRILILYLARFTCFTTVINQRKDPIFLCGSRVLTFFTIISYACGCIALTCCNMPLVLRIFFPCSTMFETMVTTSAPCKHSFSSLSYRECMARNVATLAMKRSRSLAITWYLGELDQLLLLFGRYVSGVETV